MRHEPNKAIIFRSENFLQLSPSNDVLRITEEKGSTKIEYDVKVECGQNYYGQECAIFCNPSIGSFHFKCSPDGQRLCEDGWSGQNCDDPICANGCINGYCVSPEICKCRNGWQGKNCDRCKPQDGCGHGYCNKPNECICEKNWGGTYCDRDLDYCFHNSPCLNGGKCSSGGLQNYYYCNCTAGFTGQNCEIKLNPCANVNCGKNGRCIVSWDSKSKYLCLCDASHYGDHCQYSTNDDKHQIGHSGSCRLTSSDYMPNGFSWTTVDCRQCLCQRHCVIVTEDECLKGRCNYPRGRCLSWLQINSEAMRRICRENLNVKNQNLQGCTRIYLEFDTGNLLSGTTSGDVCFHLLLDANTANFTHIGFDCQLISPNTVQVNIISLKFLTDVIMIKEFLINRLRNRLTASQILAAVTQISDDDNDDNNNSSENPMLNAILTLRDSAISSSIDSTPLTTKQMLIIIICLMLLIILILMNIAIMKNSQLCTGRKRCNDLHSNDNLLEMQLQQPTHVYTTQSLIKSDKRNKNTAVDCTYETPGSEQPFLSKLKSNTILKF
uniref:Delta-like protein n=1 Tax=Setaria digitata TaxID=48799 RepID=A0A915PMK5_9BILA